LAGVDRGFPQAETFLWRRFMLARRLNTLYASMSWSESAFDQVTAQAIYATIFVKRQLPRAEQRLHTDRTNWTLHCLVQTGRPKRQTIRVDSGWCQVCGAEPRFIGEQPSYRGRSNRESRPTRTESRSKAYRSQI